MLDSKSFKFAVSAAMIGVFSAGAIAQDAPLDSPVETIKAPVKKRVVRVVEPIPYWVKANQLRVRDNPFAGDVVGMLKMGQKIKAYETSDHWIRISAPDKPAKWINTEFISPAQVTWSNYEFGGRTARLGDTPYDVDLKRIKVKDVKDVKIYAAHIKPVNEQSKVVITRHDFRSGPYYEKRLVTCNDSDATHVRMLGEGYNYGMMEKDPRNAAISETPDIRYALSNETVSAVNRKIAEFSCKRDSL